MERGLFLNAEKQTKLEDFGLSVATKDTDEFQSTFFEKLRLFTLDSLKKLDEDVKKNLYFIGSFGLGQPSLFSDLDLCFIGDLSKTDKRDLEDILRQEFRKYSLLIVKTVDDLSSVSNFKTLVSLRSIRPVFSKDEDIKKNVEESVIQPKLDKIKVLVREETLKRRSRFGEESGRLLFSFKTASGGILDLKTLDLFKKKDHKKEEFIYKIRVLNQILYKKDQFYVTHASRLFKLMGFETEMTFFKGLFDNLRIIKEEVDEVLFGKNDWLSEAFSEFEIKISAAERDEYLGRVNRLWGRVNSPNYHIYTVGEHLKTCLLEMVEVIKNEGGNYYLDSGEKEILLWAALFHDLGKDQIEVPHSRQGSIYAQEFGRVCGWSSKKIESVSWLVRQHLTLARHAFKMDAFNPELLEKLSLQGVSGRRAVMLYFLTVADTKATNPKSWSEFKKDILTAVLNKTLGFEDEFKSELMSVVAKERAFLVEGLGLKEIALVPHEFLHKDLNSELKEGFQVYEKTEGGGDFWLRYYSTKDRMGLAYQVLSFLNSIGVYVDLALFTTKSREKVVYNWFKVESSLSFNAFQKRLNASELFQSIDASGDLSKAKLFDAIQIRYKTHNYAVLSFKGVDRPELLLAAVEVLAGASMSILWGHAVTWGRDVEDIFGVSFDDESDWNFVEV